MKERFGFIWKGLKENEKCNYIVLSKTKQKHFL